MIHRVCLLCHRPTTRKTKSGDHVCANCQAAVGSVVELMFLRDALYASLFVPQRQDPRAANAQWN